MNYFYLKPILISFFLASITFSVEAQVLDSLGCTGALGDVKYSILEPDDFQEVNGDCWTLMDGKNLDPSSELADKGFTFLPDARGVFIRSYDNRQTNRQDVDRNFGEPIGYYQTDQFKAHSHSNANISARGFPDGSGDRTTNYYLMHPSKGSDYIMPMGSSGGSETRPKNITLWTYVRIY